MSNLPKIWSHLPKKSSMENLIFCALRESQSFVGLSKKLRVGVLRKEKRFSLKEHFPGDWLYLQNVQIFDKLIYFKTEELFSPENNQKIFGDTSDS